MIVPALFVKKKIRLINSATLINEELLVYLHRFIADNKDAVVIFNNELSARHQRNIARKICAQVLDRNEIIIKIFANRARSFEGKLQVELAQLKHQSSRLVREWTHLERQKGGIGLRGGPGEKQIESDRRIIRQKINKIEKRLASVVQTRAQNRQRREKSHTKTVALVGYTNVGKSTLFNRLSKKQTYVADEPFASLDSNIARFYMGPENNCVVIDTIGFISSLPTELVNSFKSSLEEVLRADLILHVIDHSSQQAVMQQQSVEDILQDIGATDIPRVNVFNKSDQVEIDTSTNNVYVSALFNLGLNNLRDKIKNILFN